MIVRELLLSLGLATDEASFAKGMLAAKGIEKVLGGIVHTVTEVARSFIENTKAAIEYGDKLDEASQAVGVTTKSLQELRYAASLGGVGAEELDHSMMKLSRTMAAAKDGSEESQKAFSRLGVRVTDGNGKLRNADDVIGDLAEKFQKMPDGAAKTAAAMEFFGRSGARLIPTLNLGRDGLAQLRQEANDLGLVMGDDAVKASAELGDNLDRLKGVTKGLWRSAIEPLLAPLNDVVKSFLEWRKANAALIRQSMQRWITGLIRFFQALGAVISATFNTAMAVIRPVWEGLKAIGGYLSDLIGKLGAAKWVVFGYLAYMFSPLLAVIAAFTAIALLVDDYMKFKSDPEGKKYRTLFGELNKGFNEWMKPRDTDPWWLKAVKDLVRYLREAQEIYDAMFGTAESKRQASMANRGASRSEIQQRADQGTIETAKSRLRLNLPLTDAERAALGRAGITEGAFISRYGEAPPSIARRGDQMNAGVMVQAPVSIQVNGGNPEEIKPLILDALDSWWGGVTEAAAAGRSR